MLKGLLYKMGETGAHELLYSFFIKLINFNNLENDKNRVFFQNLTFILGLNKSEKISLLDIKVKITNFHDLARLNN